jgi:hypothetical protein
VKDFCLNGDSGDFGDLRDGKEYCIFIAMRNLRRSKNALVYCLKVWITCILTGPIILILCQIKSLHDFSDVFMTFYLAVVIGSVFSSTGFLFLWVGLVCLRRLDWKVKWAKLLLAGWALFVFIFLFSYFRDLHMSVSKDDEELILFYGALLTASIFFYRWPEKRVLGEAA